MVHLGHGSSLSLAVVLSCLVWAALGWQRGVGGGDGAGRLGAAGERRRRFGPLTDHGALFGEADDATSIAHGQGAGGGHSAGTTHKHKHHNDVFGFKGQ